MRVATHSGSFHADDVFALAALTRLVAVEPALGPLEIVRSRDPELLAAADLRVDVGQRDDPASGDFDHHQRGGAGERPNGIRYASFGLVWREFGARIAGGGEQAETIARRIDEVLVQAVDANDTGQTISSPLIADVAPVTVSHAIAAFNPNWDEEASADAKRAAFDEALAFAHGILTRELASASASVRAAELVRAAITRAEDPRLIELDRGLPWHRELVPSAPEALYVLYPREQDWGLQAVPRVLGEFANRKDLPEAWAGRSDAELAEVTGVADARFCHIGRFMAVAGSREGALELARQALAHVD
ncbi:MYG1 family protein [Conexibacter sp. JD483]|uniref:MYG1 family protein n=1 Tax=unclassified Conexibacter TaxID=2627773 RepID=UPI0027266828|nr:MULTISPECIES: MYG1 family protein [unclassified Conexibacter]MDO8184496.1 MYG1 family protein [Conexibacter sp. CPCC 205706]MDO8197802.1 MYG1 family protein [Conexibacter sp. CPCC 205762]MDR9369208.1 MYG1 family protein [Conexibacter sp. JD483]